MKKLLIFLIPVLLNSCCTMSQIPTQYYFVNDSCEYYLPDYTGMIEAKDNCCIKTYYQTPSSGQKLVPGQDVQVTIFAEDCSGNKSWMKFDVVTVDTIPPSFWYDSTLFTPIGMYQDSIRTWHLYIIVDSTSYDSIKGYDNYWLYYRDELMTQRMDAQNDLDSLQYPVFQRDGDHKIAYFVASSTYVLEYVKVYMAREGEPTGDIDLSIYEVDSLDNFIGDSVLARGYYQASRLWDEEQYLWHTVEMNRAVIRKGHKYALHGYVPGATETGKVVWVNTATWGDKNRYLRYSYDHGVTMGKNPTMCYTFETWGKPLYEKESE
jgi:hypothetical protein